MGDCRVLLFLALLLCGSAVPSPQRGSGGSGIAAANAQITPTSDGAGGNAYQVECAAVKRRANAMLPCRDSG